MLDLNQQTEYVHYSFEQLAKHCQACTKCGLSKTRTQVVFGCGPVPCQLMIIGEGPGEDEDRQGQPFVGRSGQLLNKILETIGINRDKHVYIANSVKCRPPQNRTPHLSEIDACKPYLIRQIQLVKPKIMLLLGSASLKAVLDQGMSITKSRGNWYVADVDYMDDKLFIMPLFHPSYLLRHESREKGSPKWLTWQDMQEVKVALDFYQD